MEESVLLQSCNAVVNSSNQTYQLQGASCGQASIVFQPDIRNSSVSCNGQTLASRSSITLNGNDSAVELLNCTLQNAVISLSRRSSLYIIGSDIANFTPRFSDGTSNITVGHYLRVNVFEPYGYNSTQLWGGDVAAFDWLFPLMNRTVNPNNTQLQMGEFFGNFSKKFAAFQKRIPFGAYNMSQSKINRSEKKLSYGKIEGSRVFAVPDYTLSKTGKIYYNPYEVDYSFLSYDQLVEFTLNVTKNMNLTPVYIQPIYPPFSWKIIPDNGMQNITIKYVVAVPPQDLNWNFTAYLYRYPVSEFVLNPIAQGVGPHSSLVKAFSFPDSKYSAAANGTLFYFVNFTSPVRIGLNLSIMSIVGNIPKQGSFVQDSTTPAFSFGLGFCAEPNNQHYADAIPTITAPGTYHMVRLLQQTNEPTSPQLIGGACKIGVRVTGQDINIDCQGGTINDTQIGISIVNSSNVNIDNCNIKGNGIEVNNSRGVTIQNLDLSSANKSDFGIKIKDSLGVGFYNLSINGSYATPFTVFSSAGTPFSEAIEIHNLTVSKNISVSAIRQFAYIYGSTVKGVFDPIAIITKWLGPYGELALLTVVLAGIYLYLFVKLQHGPSKAKRPAKGK